MGYTPGLTKMLYDARQSNVWAIEADVRELVANSWNTARAWKGWRRILANDPGALSDVVLNVMLTVSNIALGFSARFVTSNV